jgi:hypothetical protein
MWLLSRPSLLAVAMLVAFPLPASAGLFVGPQLHYDFDNDALSPGGFDDQSDHARNGSPQDLDGAGSGMSFSADVPLALQGGQSLDLRGTTDAVRSDTPGYDGVTGTAARTVAAWIKVEDGVGPDGKHILEWGRSPNGQRWSFRVDDSGGLRAEVQGGFLFGTTKLDDGTWHHVAATLGAGDPIQDVQLYVDGAPESIAGQGSQAIDTAGGTNVAVGNSPLLGNNRPLPGMVDDAAVWSEALDDWQIAGLAEGAFNPSALPESQAPATVLLATDFTGRDVDGAVASDIAWSTNGLEDPGDLTVEDGNGNVLGPGLFDTADAQGHFAPDRNVDNEGPWSVEIELALAGPRVELTDVTLDWQHFNNGGALQSVSRDVDWTLTVHGSSSGVIGTAMATGIGGTSGVETISFDSPLLLGYEESYHLELLAEGATTDGNNTGLDGLIIQGNIVPEPSTATMLLCAVAFAPLGLLRRRRAAERALR